MKTIRLCLAAAVAGLLSGAALAAPEPPRTDRSNERIIIVTNDGPRARDREHVVRRFHVVTSEGVRSRCSGEKSEVNETSRDGRERTHIIVCADSKTSAADRAASLERVLSRIQGDRGLSPEHKEKVAAALREAIEQARSGR